MQDLIDAYRHTRRCLRAHRTLTVDKADRERFGEMISSTEYALKWMNTGRDPNSMRGIERRYRVKVWDPDWIVRYEYQNARRVIERDTSIKELSAEDRLRIEEAMYDLSDRERQCFILHYVDLMSFEEIGLELHLGKSTAQSYVVRAKEKIEEAKATNLFLNM